MPTLEEARRLILEHTQTLGTESVELIDSLSLVLAENLAAPCDLPLCDNSAMDGFAVRRVDCAPPARLRITGFIPAGSLSMAQVDSGCAVKIMTGARIPPGCDAVIPFEQTEGRDDYVTIKAPIRENQHIRFAGEDVLRGEVIIPAGTVIRAPEISMMASYGMSRVTVFRRPRVAILSTGDELVELGEPFLPGKIVDSNGVSLAALVKACGAVVEQLGIAKDTRASHVAKMTIGLQADILITSAGVSVGERDLVRDVLAELGMVQVFYSIDARPGGPTTFGVKDGRLVFCLPGNPVASMIVFDELVKPAILKAMGYKRIFQPFIRAVLQENVSKKVGRVKFLRVRLEPSGDGFLAFSSGDQTTGKLKTLLRADGIAVLPAERSSFSAGDEVNVHVISNNSVMLSL
jgi:molybdopterin molybdotransferase